MLETGRRHDRAGRIRRAAAARRYTLSSRGRGLPATLDAALAALDASEVFRGGFGDGFVDYLLLLKRAELARYHAEVSEWEQREYFDLF